MKHRIFYSTVLLVVSINLLWLSLRGSYYSVFCWPAISFLLVSIAYCFDEVRIFGKQSNGSRRCLATVILLPYLIFARLIWLLQILISSEPAYSTINDSLIISRRLRAWELPQDVTHICDLTCEFLDPLKFRENYSYICYPILDARAVDPDQLMKFAISLVPAQNGKLLIHCANGHGRTAMFAAIWLLVHFKTNSSEEAIEILKASRPAIRLKPIQKKVVDQTFHMTHSSTTSYQNE
ncbi:dual specificity protein phosphatase family protein [uncultured Rubinisphaera sp.]|uniref:dual specificity protein phosphatase family protein n=1 Tax=uncultured Rubinisphaera sp. TaxID=1678686 RepID=UPI0030DD247C